MTSGRSKLQKFMWQAGINSPVNKSQKMGSNAAHPLIALKIKGQVVPALVPAAISVPEQMVITSC